MSWRPGALVAAVRRNPWCAVAAVAIAGVCVLHLAALGSSPPGLYIDEASVGYNAWAVAHTGHDEHGHFLPFYFQAFGEYKNPVYIYALVPFTWVLPLTAYVVRLPAALFGLATCALLALFARAITRSNAVALLTFVTAGITPWLTQESRIAFEVVAMVALLALMLWCLARAAAEDSWRWYAAAGVALGLSTFAYSTGRAFTVALSVAVLLSFGVRPRSRAWMAALVGPLASVAILAAYNAAHGGAILARFNSISITFDHPAPLTVVQRFLSNYADYWDVHFLFTHGDSNPRHSTGFGGMLLVTTLPVLLAGAVVCLRRWREPLPRFLLLGAVLAPVPAALTAEGTPHSLRAATMLPFLLALTAYGWAALVPALSARRLATAVLGAAVAVEAGGYFQDMFTQYPDRALVAFDTGVVPAVQSAVLLAGHHEVYLSTSFEAATIKALFALHPDPPAAGASQQDVLAAIRVRVTDPDSMDSAANPGDILVLTPDDPVPPEAEIVYVDRRSVGGGPVEAHGQPPQTVPLVVVARELSP